MNQVTRRKLLGEALAAGAGATILSRFASDEAAIAATSGVDEPVIDRNFLAGRLVDEAAGVFVAEDPDGTLRRVRLPTEGRVWKRGRWNASKLAIGDCLYARGTLDGDGVLQVANAWVGIYNIAGTVARSGAGGLDLTLPNGRELPVSVGAVTRNQDASTGREGAGLGNLRAGEFARIIGYHDNANGDPVATLVMHGKSAEPGPDGESETRRSGTRRLLRADALCPCLVEGVATWQCCGGVNACGSGNFAGCQPPPGSTGACLTCRTDRQGVAWPNIINAGGQICQPTPSSCAVTLDRFNCGKQVGFTNKCTSQQIIIPVNDCGPVIHCVTGNRCMGYIRVKFDLTACSFTAIGGNLGAGLIDVWATY